MSEPVQKPCPGCGAKPGELHEFGCNFEQCPDCGKHMAECNEDMNQPTNPRLPWTGELPGVAECREFGFWFRWKGPKFPDPPRGWISCDKDHPDAIADIIRLRKECRWDAAQGRFVRKEECGK